MAASYPARERYFSHRFCRILTKAAMAQDIGPEACWLLTVIVHQEDAKRYRGPVTYYNEQLMPLCGFSSAGRLIRARDKAVEAGWLHYKPGYKGKPGIYWCLIPDDCESIPDTPMDEDSSRDIPFQNGNANGRKTEGNRRETVVQTEGNRSANGNLPTLDPKSLSLNPKEISAGAEICSEPDEASDSPPPPVELTEYEFPCTGKGPKTWALPKAKFQEYLESYPGLDIRAEIRKACQWTRDNPGRRKTSGGMLRFLTSWLNRAQNTHHNSGSSQNGKPSIEDRNRAEFTKAIAAAEDQERNAANPPNLGGFLPRLP